MTEVGCSLAYSWRMESRTYPVLVSVGFRSEDWYSGSSMYFNMLPNMISKFSYLDIFKFTYLNVPIEFSATQE